ncbi:zinc finger and BTB domain-containing protein 49-like [Sycon ciliatum]|uniref:zinc finger and BTB domain-containing protein 49-like n=1 Tax=Sycon ciliatum TaxID=27933 RepID=UPI0031F5F39E
MAESANVVVEAIHKPPSSTSQHSEAYLPAVAGEGRLYMKEEPALAGAWGGGEVTLQDGTGATSSEEEEVDAMSTNAGASEMLLTATTGASAYFNRAESSAMKDAEALDNAEEDGRLVIMEDTEDSKFLLKQSASPMPNPRTSASASGGVACEICGKVFRQENYLHVHMRTHYGVKPYVCEQCGKAFTRTSLLAEHKRLHGNDFQFVCNICGKSYRWNSSLQLHMQTHTDKKDHVCYICKRAFRWRIALRRHMTEHAEESPFKCDTCQKCFTDSYSLAQHARVHTRERPFTCPDCGRTFRWKHQITQHACAMRSDGKTKTKSSSPKTGRKASSAAVQTNPPGRSRRSNAGNLYTLRKQMAAQSDGEGDGAPSFLAQQPPACDQSRSALLTPGASTPVVLSLSSPSGLEYTCSLSNVSSQCNLSSVAANAGILSDAFKDSEKQSLLPSTDARAHVAIDAHGQKKLVLTLPQEALDVLLRNQTPCFRQAPGVAMGSNHGMLEDTSTAFTVEAVDDCGVAHGEAALFHLQSMPVPDVTLGTPLML